MFAHFFVSLLVLLVRANGEYTAALFIALRMLLHGICVFCDVTLCPFVTGYRRFERT